jgi:hypothetical protein
MRESISLFGDEGPSCYVYPVHAGINLRDTSKVPYARCLPCACRDQSFRLFRSVSASEATPCMRGSNCRSGRTRDRPLSSPVHAGINRGTGHSTRTPGCLAAISHGDRHTRSPTTSPHTSGDQPAPARIATLTTGIPAHAGINLCFWVKMAISCTPRTNGDRPDHVPTGVAL